MSTQAVADPNLIALEDETGITAQEWSDALTLPKADFVQWVEDQKTLGRMSWAREQSSMDKVENVLLAMANLASPVTVIAGGVSGVAAMISALKGI